MPANDMSFGSDLLMMSAINFQPNEALKLAWQIGIVPNFQPPRSTLIKLVEITLTRELSEELERTSRRYNKLNNSSRLQSLMIDEVHEA